MRPRAAVQVACNDERPSPRLAAGCIRPAATPALVTRPLAAGAPKPACARRAARPLASAAHRARRQRARLPCSTNSAAGGVVTTQDKFVVPPRGAAGGRGADRVVVDCDAASNASSRARCGRVGRQRRLCLTMTPPWPALRTAPQRHLAARRGGSGSSPCSEKLPQACTCVRSVARQRWRKPGSLPRAAPSRLPAAARGVATRTRPRWRRCVPAAASTGVPHLLPPSRCAAASCGKQGTGRSPFGVAAMAARVGPRRGTRCPAVGCVGCSDGHDDAA
jgi:hypothetical protein